MNLFLFIVVVILLVISGFILIARKGRTLRTKRVLPPEAAHAFLETTRGEKYSVVPSSQFYLGRKPDSNIVILNATQDYELCIFYHRKRFAFQTLSGTEVLVNDEEQLAGYLSDGDVIKIAGESFTFHSMPAEAGAP